MHPSKPFSLARLRSHRAVWLVCLVTMLLRLTVGTLCLADGLPGGSTTGTPVSVTAAFPSTGEDCVLGEVGGCHCVCAHSVPVEPTGSVAISPALPASNDWPALAPRVAQSHLGALLRPPIA